jgi:predicted DCC family thiol-disulfide oxidoreductase YuxK
MAVRDTADFLRDSVGLPTGQRGLLLYDADCGFCTWLVSVVLQWDRAERLRPIALQCPEADELLGDLMPAERMASWHLISPGDARRSAGDAVAPLLRLLPRGRVPAAAFARFPKLTDRGYRWVAEHRSHLSKWVPSSAKGCARRHVRRREQDREIP